MTKLIYRPTLSARIGVLQNWFTPEKFRVAWELAKIFKELKGCKAPVSDLVSDLDYSNREVYRWLNDEADPSRRAFLKIDKVFSAVIGHNWETVVNSLSTGGENREST